MSNLVIDNLQHYNNLNFFVQIEKLEVREGEIVCLLGPSGCGKSTTLRLAAGLEKPDQGNVFINGTQVAGDGLFVGAEERRVGLVFQDYALFPHLTVQDNVTFGLDGMSAASKKAIATRILEKLALAGSADDYPHTLSGGEQQRVALARALAPNPKIILMDEPFSGLDVVLRNSVRDETLALLKESGASVMLVTHDPEEAMRMADRIVLMKNGRIEQQGTPAELYSQPNSEFVASFLGDVNKVSGQVKGDVVQTGLGDIPLAEGQSQKGSVSVYVRPEAIRLGPVTDMAHPSAVVGRIRNLGPFSLIDLELDTGHSVVARAASILRPEEGQRYSISLDLRQVFIF
ncbi:ABC transporter ATP-binding protein [Sneathiella sp.]|jgi:iron(III) transport system ATP-binding protein|uniref:ABC transporter ATP-binding protein n=1 Tax=Sneathiella sp. TaxID=1964365 RepID=UPI0039E2C0CB